MRTDPRLPLERLAYAALATLTLAPAALPGLWRPFAQGGAVDAMALSWAAVGVAVTASIAGAAVYGRAAHRWLPGASALLAAAVLGPLVGWGTPDLGVVTAALLVVAIFVGALGPWLVRNLPADLDGAAARGKVAAAGLVALGVLTVVGTARLSAFMGDATRPELSLMPDIPFMVHHACLTAYVQGAHLATNGVANLYEASLWPHLSDTAVSQAQAVPYAPFGLDAYAYPPTFLLLPRLLLTPLADFAAQRAVWFSLNALFFALGLWVVARWLGGPVRTRALLLAPLVWVTLPTMVTFQVGNAHSAVVVAVMLALVAFETGRPALGGGLLAFTTLAKISPGLLILLLLLQRRYREVLWTAAWCVVFVLLALAVFGVAPFVAFVSYELPRLSTGEAMTFLAWKDSVIINNAPFGIPFKLAALGLNMGDPWAWGRILNQIFSVALLGLAFLASRKGGGVRAKAEVWAALLTLASLRSPLAPGYVAIALLWGMSIAAVDVRGARRVIGAAALWFFVGFGLPLQGTPGLVQSAVQQAVIIGAALYYLLRRPPVDASVQAG